MIARVLTRMVLVLGGFCLPPLIFEFELRIEHWLSKGIPLSTNPRDRWDSVLGWEGREHVLPGDSVRPVLVIGDSFTDGLTVAPEKMWFSSLQQVYPGRQVIAYGGLGYGTLQELMILERYLERGVRPGLVVLQLCSNDILNNFFPLEQRSYLQRAPGPRPYQIRDRVEVKFPRAYDSILLPLVSYSRVAYKYNNRWDTKLAKWANERKIDSVEFEIQREGASFSLFKKGVAVTDRLIRRIRDTMAGVPIVALLVDDYEPYTSALKSIVRSYKIPMVVPTHQEPLTEDMRLPDGAHYNEEGNRILGERFIAAGRARDLFPVL